MQVSQLRQANINFDQHLTKYGDCLITCAGVSRPVWSLSCYEGALSASGAPEHHTGSGRPVQLGETAPYRSLYLVHCSKKRDRVLGEAADDECEYRAAVVHTSFGRDPYVQGAQAMLASSEVLQAKLLSMYLGQVQMVARGDDLRGRKLKDLGTRTLACVGEFGLSCGAGHSWCTLAATSSKCDSTVVTAHAYRVPWTYSC